MSECSRGRRRRQPLTTSISYYNNLIPQRGVSPEPTPPLENFKKKAIFETKIIGKKMNNDLDQKKEYSAPKMEIVQLRQESMLLEDSKCECPPGWYCCGEVN